jgi:tetratricopeptide (TPR) repeat protein
MNAPHSSARVPHWKLAALLGAATLAVYLPSIANGFVQMDDPGYVFDNARVQAGLSRANVAWAFRTLDMANWHPLAWISHMADCQLYGLIPAGHHFTSILLHVANAVLLFLLLAKSTGARWRSLFASALFALHPLAVETVSWISERKSLLSFFFSLCAIGLYGWYARRPSISRYLAMAAAFALALLSKPMAVTLPALLLILDCWPLGRMGKRRWLALVAEKVPLFLMSAASSWITIVAQARSGAVSSVEAIPITFRLINAVRACATYLRRMLWPDDLAYFYPLRRADLTFARCIPALLLLLLITALGVRFRRQRYLLSGWLWFLAALLPVIGILQVGLQSMADRYTYVPLVGPFVATAWLLAELASRLRVGRTIQAGVALMIVASLTTCTVITEGYWRNDLTLFTRAHQVTSPPSFYIETNLAGALSDENRISEALQCYRRAAELAPAAFDAHYNLGYMLARNGDPTGAVSEFQQALLLARNNTEKARADKSLGFAFLNLGESQQALSIFKETLSLAPRDGQLRQLVQAMERSGPSH